MPMECEDIFFKLMNEGVNFASRETNEFATALLCQLGIILVCIFCTVFCFVIYYCYFKFKSKRQEYLRDEISTPLLETLALWLINIVNEKDVFMSHEALMYLRDSFQK